jgi:hypothetical protein
VGLKSIAHHVLYRLEGVHVIALVGKAGTGKSFRAQLIARKQGIDLIIDDGLVIRDQRIVAGQSAKQAAGAYSAVKVALFDDPRHRAEVRHQLARLKFKRVLILGTSVRMVHKIADRLDLPPPGRIINIEEVATKSEIERALRSRTQEGKHIIPVPAVEVRHRHSKIFFNSVLVLFKKSLGMFRRPDVFEKSVVRPLYTNKGRVTISEQAMTQMIFHCVNEYAPAVQVTRVTFLERRMEFAVEVHIAVPYGLQVTGLIHNLQGYIVQNIEDYTGITLSKVDVIVDSVSDRSRPR